MKAIILAAGEGKRLRPFTETMPKVMLPVGNKPILEYVLDSVTTNGIDDIIIIVGYQKEVIMDYFSTYEKGNITYITQDKQLGTGHALLQAENHIETPFIVIPGDNIIDHKSIAHLRETSSEYAMLIKQHPHPSKYGVVTIENNHLTSFVEKPKDGEGSYISTGIYKLPPSIFSDLATLTSQGLHTLSSAIENLLIQHIDIDTIIADTWMDIVYPWNLIGVNEAVMHQTAGSTAGTIEKNVTIKGPVTIKENTHIYAGTYIVGPVIIGSGCEIGPNVCIFPSTAIGNNTVIHPFTELHNSVIMQNTHIGSHTHISHSIIGQGTVIHPHFTNIPGPATIEIENEFLKLENIGVMIGEDTTIGCNTISEPGIIIGRSCTISPLTKITRAIPSGQNVM
ncbi:MAG: NTP transferase domain-containing protein [Candidatus Thermoplasmatota archaeon]|nr:NTP transferase domain-containing protein [Candidatus Thermoplasmatota archaeon]